MCDYSLQNVRSRPAKVGDKLVTRDFGTGTRGFAAADDREVAVCVMPGTELAFARDVACLPSGLLGWKMTTVNHRTAIFRQMCLCVPKTLSVLIGGKNHLTSAHNDRAVIFYSDRLGLAI